MRRLNKIKIKYATILIAVTIVCLAILPTFMRYRVDVTANVIGYAKETRSSTYKVKFHNNGGTGTMDEMTVTYGVAQNLTKNTFSREDYNFGGWNTETDGSGANYSDEQEINNTTYITGNEINLYAQWVSGIAEVNGVVYPTLQEAVNAVTTSTPTTVKLLANTEEQITVSSTQNIIFNLQNYSISRTSGADGVIENYGTISISNGTLRSTIAASVINNYKGATLYISGGNLIGTSSTKGQAIYNKGGTVHISGNAYLSTNSSNRATVHNLADGTTAGTVIITGGTIISNNFSAIINDKNSIPIIIGMNDGTVDKTTPVIQGEVYGLNINTSGRFELYDGIIKGKTQAINSENTLITSRESGYNIAHGEEIINGKTYKTAYLSMTNTVIFNPNGGSVDEPTRNVENGMNVGSLPVPERSGYIFNGWYTAEEDGEGEEVLPSRIITSDNTFYAHWSRIVVAEINGTQYYTLQEAIDAVSANNTQTTITVLRDISENITVDRNKDIVFDLSNYTLSNATSNATITNNGTITITNGTIAQRATYAAINNNTTGKVIMTGGRIDSMGGRSAIYTIGNGIVEISGNAYLTSNASGATADGYLRATLMSVSATSNTTVTGGTIEGTKGTGVFDRGIITVGVKSDEVISNSTPVIFGETYGIESTGTFSYYDGMVMGITSALDGTIADQEPNTHIVNGTDVVDGKTYYTVHLEIDT